MHEYIAETTRRTCALLDQVRARNAASKRSSEESEERPSRKASQRCGSRTGSEPAYV